MRWWLAIWAFWLIVTRSFHPTFPLALLVTTALVSAYLAAAWINQCVAAKNCVQA